MPDGVTGTANALHLLQAKACLIGDLARPGSKGFSQKTMQKAGLLGVGCSGASLLKEQVAQVAWIGVVQGVNQSNAQVQTDVFRFNQGDIDADRAGARGQADKPPRRHGKSPGS